MNVNTSDQTIFIIKGKILKIILILMLFNYYFFIILCLHFYTIVNINFQDTILIIN